MEIIFHIISIDIIDITNIIIINFKYFEILLFFYTPFISNYYCNSF
jgi:hypothetical protein